VASTGDMSDHNEWPADHHQVQLCLYHAQGHLIADCPDAWKPIQGPSIEYDVRCACRILQACADLVALTWI
jgi:hypothetical protein